MATPAPALQSEHESPEERPFHVLVTGFGRITHLGENPSWLAVKPLHNTILLSDPAPRPIIVDGQVVLSDDDDDLPRRQRPIHITALKIPDTYEDVLGIVPKLHTRPPVLPEADDRLFPPPPDSGYDFIFHLGVAGRGPLRMERQGHKLGYHMKDASGKLAAVVRSLPKDFSRRPDDLSVAESVERERLGIDMAEAGGDVIARPTRGFGPAYENFPDEILTDIDVTKLVHDLKRSGIEQIYTSMDAGHYLSDFIYYCSLAEAKRTAKPYEKRRNTQVLFLHCPPVGQPLSTEEVTEAVKRIIVFVCREIQINDDANGEIQEHT